MKPISTGLIDFEIPFSNGDTETLTFNPNDVEFYGKLTEFEEKMRSAYENLESVKNDDASPKEIIAKIRRETDVKIKNIFDDLFGAGAGRAVFKYASPTSFVNNQYYPYYFLSEFMPEVAAKMSETNAEATKNARIMLEHTAPYINRR